MITGRPHTDKEYEGDLNRLREQILLMGAHVERMIRESIRCLVDRDAEAARRIIEGDREVDQLELMIDRMCLNVLALRQPVAKDLRFITIVLKMVRDLERIGDLAVNISERVIELNEEPPLKAYVDIPRMADEVTGMVRDALDALVNADEVMARNVIERDDVVDEAYDRILRILLTYMMENPRNIYRATRLQSIAKCLERVSDHATNLAEMVVFNAVGTDIRHSRGKGDPPLPEL
jgi:phosphate transport system protein